MRSGQNGKIGQTGLKVSFQETTSHWTCHTYGVKIGVKPRFPEPISLTPQHRCRQPLLLRLATEADGDCVNVESPGKIIAAFHVPLEWLWRLLTYWRPQPMLVRTAEPVAAAS